MEKTVTINGMKCDGCVTIVTDKFLEITGVNAVDVNLEAKQATIDAQRDISNEELRQALNETKFTVE